MVSLPIGGRDAIGNEALVQGEVGERRVVGQSVAESYPHL
jgi:hypothetical protein